MKINVVMVEPEIPQNTGNIARTCAAIGAKLHLVYPLGFSISEKAVKRAGLDYWDKLEIEEHTSFEEFLINISLKKIICILQQQKENMYIQNLIIVKWMKYFYYLERKQKDFQKTFYKNILTKL